MKRKAAERDKVWEFAWIFLAVIVLVLVIAIRVRLLAIPLERDEGEYAYAGQLLLRGIPPYKLAYNVKFPGTCYLCELNCACARRSSSSAASSRFCFHSAWASCTCAFGASGCERIAAW